MSDVAVKPLKDGDLNVQDDSGSTIFQDGIVTPNGMTQVNINPDAVKDAKGADMAKKAEAGTDPQKLIAGKFKTQEDFDKSILEAVKKKHGDKLEDYYKTLTGNLKPEPNVAQTDNSQTSDNSEGDDKGEGEKVEPDASEDVPDNVLEDINPHMTKFVEEFSKDGKLSDDSYEKLAKVGYDKPMVDTFLKGVQTIQNDLYAKVGGKENYSTMQTWAAENLTEAEIDLFNEDMNSGNTVRMDRAVDTLASKYVKVNGGFAPKRRVSPEGGEINPGVTGYTSLDQLKADMRDPRYQTDASFRDQVKLKLKFGKI